MYFKYVLVFFHFRLSARETAMCQITKTFTVFNKQKQKVHVFMANKLTLSLIAMAYLENHHIFKAVCFSFERYNISMVRKTKKNERRTLFLFTRRTNKSEQINRDVECLRHSQHSWTKTMKMFVCILFSHLVFARSHSFSLYHWPMCLCIRIYGWVCLVSVYTHFVIHFYEWQLTEKYLRANKTCTLFLAPFEIYMTKKYDAKYSKRARKTKQQQQQSMAGKNETGVKSEEHQTVVHELKKKRNRKRKISRGNHTIRQYNHTETHSTYTILFQLFYYTPRFLFRPTLLYLFKLFCCLIFPPNFRTNFFSSFLCVSENNSSQKKMWKNEINNKEEEREGRKKRERIKMGTRDLNWLLR